jgi:ketosteroid isomerase-like protein
MTVLEELAAINVGYGRALLEQDAERVAAYYADDGRLLLHGSPIICGRAAIEAIMREWLGEGPQVLRFETGELIADGSLVVDIGAIVGPSSRSKYVVVYQRQPDGSLRIAADATTSDGTPPAS